MNRLDRSENNKKHTIHKEKNTLFIRRKEGEQRKKIFFRKRFAYIKKNSYLCTRVLVGSGLQEETRTRVWFAALPPLPKN